MPSRVTVNWKATAWWASAMITEHDERDRTGDRAEEGENKLSTVNNLKAKKLQASGINGNRVQILTSLSHQHLQAFDSSPANMYKQIYLNAWYGLSSI